MSQITFGQIPNNLKIQLHSKSAEFFIQLKEIGIDSILVSNYSFNNGRGEEASITFMWKNKGESFQRIFRDLEDSNQTQDSIEPCSYFDEIVRFFKENEAGICESDPQYKNVPPSHDYGYCIHADFLSIDGESICARNTLLKEDSDHPRCKWILMIEKAYANKK